MSDRTTAVSAVEAEMWEGICRWVQHAIKKQMPDAAANASIREYR
jgi:hypothetical protein